MMPARRLKRDEYTVGWVCALPIELAAAQGMLDEEHEDLAQDSDDMNIYTLGQVGDHNVAIACLPEGQTGTNSAAAVATQMKSTFKSIRFGLLVGVGGGVPSDEADIRLGDVVVSRPYQTYGGVVQYDFGKATSSGFERTGFLNAPPRLLLSAVAKLRANGIRGKSKLREYLSTLDRLPVFAREDAGPDVLYETTYNHEGGATCGDCDEDRQVIRQPRRQEVSVHFGTIASGNQVMRDAAQRDKVSADLGGVLCFEMEAAGLMNSFPCLVIRGICDYADSHKNKKWQAYAAGTAAACAKEILSVIPSAEVRQMATAEQVTNIASLLHFSRNEFFVGCEGQLRSLEEQVSPSHGHRRLTICGLGGCGKSALALEFAYRTKAKHAGCMVFWVSAVSRVTFELAYREIGILLDIPGITNDNADVMRLVKEELSKSSVGDWLMIVDSADDPDVLLGVPCGDATTGRFSDYLPHSDRGAILFTTRDKKTAHKLTPSHVIELIEMKRDEAKQLMVRRVSNKALIADDNAVDDLLKLLTYLPLAIVQAVAFINSNDMSVPDYNLLFKKESAQAELLRKHFEDPTRYQKQESIIAKTWHISFDQIQKQDWLAAKYLSFLACVDHVNIPRSLLPAEGSVVEQAEAIGTLKGYAFITERQHGPQQQSQGEKFFDMHRLVQMASICWMEEHGELKGWVARAASRLEELVPFGEHDKREVWINYLSHAIHVADYEDELGVTARVSLLTRVGRCQTTLGQYSAAEMTHRKALSLRDGSLEDEDRMALTAIMNHLAIVLDKQGKEKEVDAMNRQMLAQLEEGLEEEGLEVEYEDTLVNMGNLALVLRRQGRYEDAEAMNRQVLARLEKVLGPEHPNTLTTMSNLVLVLDCQGKYEEAEAMNRQTLALQEKVLGAEHPLTLASMSNLALVLDSQDRYEDAEAMNKQTLARQEKVLGAEHPLTLTSMGNLAVVLANQGKNEEAEAMYRQTLARQEKVLGPEHPDTLMVVWCLSSLLEEKNQYEEAVKLHQRACEGFSVVLGHNHPTTRACHRSYSELLERK